MSETIGIILYTITNLQQLVVISIKQRQMGVSLNGQAVMDKKFIESLRQQSCLRTLQLQDTQIHEIYFHSLEHHQIMLQKIRSKKKYDCPFIIKILDSHTVQSQNFCSTLIKMYIVVQKPKSLAEEIQRRLTAKMGFSESEIWTLIYSCVVGGSYFIKNNVGLVRLSANRVYIDKKGNIKINDPQLCESSCFVNNISQSSYINSIYQIALQLHNTKPTTFSQTLTTLLQKMNIRQLDLIQLKIYIQQKYLQQKNQQNRISIFGNSKLKKTTNSKSKKIRLVSKKKLSNLSQKSHEPRDTSTSALTSYDSLASYQCSNQNKENYQENIIVDRGQKQNKRELLQLKNPLMNNEVNGKNLQTEQHMFPKKALCGQRRKIQERAKEPISYVTYQNEDFQRSEQKKEGRSRHSQLVSQPSLNSSQLLNLISYQVDQQTSVRQICHEKSEYIIELLTKCKGTMCHIKN